MFDYPIQRDNGIDELLCSRKINYLRQVRTSQRRGIFFEFLLT